MDSEARILKEGKENYREKLLSARKGFTLIEILIAVGIVGLMALMLYPNIMASLEVRELEGSARDVQTTLSRARFQAVKAQLKHRVRFLNERGTWFFLIEREDTPSHWSQMPGLLRKEISSKFTVTVDFPNLAVEFSPLGFVSNFDSAHNAITLQSAKLAHYNQPDQRAISIFVGGSVKYIKTTS
jgi:prepilin-type N-terminal cleavage/methylation domain-containing protein